MSYIPPKLEYKPASNTPIIFSNNNKMETQLPLPKLLNGIGLVAGWNRSQQFSITSFWPSQFSTLIDDQINISQPLLNHTDHLTHN